MKGILIVAHGSKEKTTERTLEVLAEKVCRISDADRLEIGFMEFSPRTIHVGLDVLREHGCAEILVIPYFLFDGIHIRRDIPELLDDYVAAHKDVNIRLGHTLGADDRLAQMIAEQAAEVAQ